MNLVLNASELQVKLQLQTDEGNIYKSVVKLLEDNWQMIWDARPNVRKNAVPVISSGASGIVTKPSSTSRSCLSARKGRWALLQVQN